MSDQLLTPSIHSKIYDFVDTLPDADKLTSEEIKLIVSFFFMCLSLKRSRAVNSIN